MRKLAVLGLGLALIGLVLALAFWPAFSVSGAQLRAAESGGQYVGYSPGQRILVHARVVDVSYADFFGFSGTLIQLDSGDPDNPVGIYVPGDARSAAPIGGTIYASAVLQQTIGGLQYWEVSTPSDIQAVWPIDDAFIGLIVLGAGMVAIDSVRGRHRAPEG